MATIAGHGAVKGFLASGVLETARQSWSVAFRGDAVKLAEDHAADELPEAERRSTMSIGLVRMGYTISAADLLFGLSLGLSFNFWTALLVAFSSSIAICVISALCGLIGQREGLTTALIMRLAFGREGSRIPSLVIAILGAGFVGFGTAITASVLPGHSRSAWLVYIVVLSTIYTVLSTVGFTRGLTWVARISVPLMGIVVAIAAGAAIYHAGGWSGLLDAAPAHTGNVSTIAFIALGTAKWITGAAVSPDITRFAKGTGAVYLTTMVEFIFGNFAFNLVGIVLGLAAGASDMGKALEIVGVGGLAGIAIFVQGFPHEINSLYLGSLAGRNAVGIGRLYVNVLLGVAAAGLAYYGLTRGLLHSYLVFLAYLSYVMPLIPGIMIADYFIVHRGRYLHRVADAEAINWRAAAAFSIGLVVNLFLGLVLRDSIWHTMPIIGFVLYLTFSPRRVRMAWLGGSAEGTAPFAKPFNSPRRTRG